MQTIENWSPLHFLAALGAGGMVVTFFMFLLFWVPHPGQPVPDFHHWYGHFQQSGLLVQGMISIALAGILIFTWLHLKWLVVNFKMYGQFKREGGIEKIMGTNAHTQLLAIPLTLGMTLNALFIFALQFVPGLWSVIEWVFPFSILAFLLMGIWASRVYLCFFGHVLQHGSFDKTINNSLAQLLPSFAFTMIGVGLAAPAAMSHNEVVISISYLLSLFFISTALFLGMIKLIIGMNDLFKSGASLSSLPTLWVIIPILTIAAIAIMRLSHGMHSLELGEGATNSVMLVIVFSLQIMFALMGMAVMKRMNYFQLILSGEEKTPVTFALICPGVALVVMGHFFINRVLVDSGMIEAFGPSYIVLSVLAVSLQVLTGWLLLKLARFHF